MVKRVNFSLYGTNPKYNIGAIKNVDLYQKYLPDWEINIFAHSEMSDIPTLTILEKNGANINWVDNVYISNIGSCNYPMFWRLTNFFDDTPSLSRDLDSRLYSREIEYIRRWEQTDNSIFTIKDHPWHSRMPGGLIGMKNNGIKFKTFFEKYIITGSTIWGADEQMLENFVDEYNLNDDIFCCSYENENYIPRPKNEFFIGIQLNENDEPCYLPALDALNNQL
jgi:hypothetical protein